LIVFSGLGLLGTEYAWARRLLRWVRDELRRWTQWVAARPLWFRLLAGLVSLAFLAGLVALGWWMTIGF
jgi:putative transmembrane protein PGPGW